MILALDISTSCTGWCIFNNQGGLEAYGFIDLSKHKGLYEKASKVKAELLKIKKQHSISEVVVEDNLQAFRPGLSSAKTLMTLAQFNGVVRWLCHSEINVPISAHNVNSARKAVELKINKKSNKKTKEQVWDWVKIANSKDTVKIKWPFKTLKSGPNKGQIRLCTQAYDVADAYVIGRAHFVL